MDTTNQPNTNEVTKKEEESKNRPIKMRDNPFANKETKKWWQVWKKPKEYGVSIKLTDEQAKEAYNLSVSKQPVVIKILDEQYKNIPEPETIEPVLFLMKENGYTDVLENVKSGEFIIQTPKGEKSIWLTPEKMQSIKLRDKYYRGWIAYENCMTPYPEDPIYSSELQRRIIQKVAINYRDINEAQMITAKTKLWLTIIGAVTLALVLLFSTDFGQGLMAQFTGGAKQATQAVVNVVSDNVTTNPALEEFKENLTNQIGGA